jgi:hypothetical protein
MSEELYAPPQARIAEADDVPGEFYLVSPRKFILLFVFTIGLYSVFWFYQNWSLYRRRHGLKLWPAPRAIFQIFFTHSLFDNVDQSLRRSGRRYAWSPGTQATLYVVLLIVSTFIDRLVESDSPVVLGLMILSSLLPGLPLLVAQRAINLAENDAAGSRNSALSAANLAWIIAGALVWLILMAGLAFIAFNPELGDG